MESKNGKYLGTPATHLPCLDVDISILAVGHTVRPYRLLLETAVLVLVTPGDRTVLVGLSVTGGKQVIY